METITMTKSQAYDSLTVTWSDSPSSDLDSTYLVYWKVNPVVDTTIFARVNEGIETCLANSLLLALSKIGAPDFSAFIGLNSTLFAGSDGTSTVKS